MPFMNINDVSFNDNGEIIDILSGQILQDTPVRERQLATIKDSVYLVKIAARLVKIAKCAMLLTGDGQSGMTRGNSLDS